MSLAYSTGMTDETRCQYCHSSTEGFQTSSLQLVKRQRHLYHGLTPKCLYLILRIRDVKAHKTWLVSSPSGVAMTPSCHRTVQQLIMSQASGQLSPKVSLQSLQLQRGTRSGTQWTRWLMRSWFKVRVPAPPRVGHCSPARYQCSMYRGTSL